MWLLVLETGIGVLLSLCPYLFHNGNDGAFLSRSLFSPFTISVATLSSQHDNMLFGPSNCLDGNADTFCHSTNEGGIYENNPYFMMEYPTPVSVAEVKVQARNDGTADRNDGTADRNDGTADRLKNVVVTVTNTKPTKGKIVSGPQLGSKFVGPASAGQWLSFTSGSGIEGKYVVVQQQYKGILNFAEVEVKLEECVPPNLTNGVVQEVSGSPSSDMYVGRFSCNPGHTLVGQNIIKCRSGKWSANLPVCTRCFKEDKIDYYGNDIKGEIVVGVDACANLCGETAACKFWSFVKSDKTCWIKTSNSDKRGNFDRVSGTRSCATGIKI